MKKALVVIIGLVAVLWVASRVAGPGSDAAALHVTAGRGILALSVTNREAVPIRDCRFRITDQERIAWVSHHDADIAPQETVSVPWSSFAYGDQSMPNYLKDRSVYVTCTVNGEERTAGIGR